MPEGDSLRRAARQLSPVLTGEELLEAWFRKLRGHRPRPGQRIEAVRAVGKHLLVDFDRQLTLRTHLGMAGSWRTAPPEARIPRDPRLRIVLTTRNGTALCYGAPVIDSFLRSAEVTPVSHLGPDLSDDAIDLDEVVDRVRRFGSGRPVVEALLDQRIAAGVGNVFKSEVAFLAGVHPFRAVDELSDDELRGVWQIAHRQLVANRDRDSRVTTRGTNPDRTYVYGRGRLACRRCPGSIRFASAGENTERSTYWCPTCQPAPD